MVEVRYSDDVPTPPQGMPAVAPAVVPAALPVRRRRRRLIAGAAAAVVLGLFGGGVATGWWAADRWSPRLAPDLEVTVGEVVSGGAAGAMPDLRGLAAAEARQVLVDLRLGATQVVVREQPSVGVAGSVVAQDPAAGEPVAATVTLVLAAAAVVPVVDGQDVSVAVRALEGLGAAVEVRRTYQPGVPADRVLAVEPAAGSAVPARVVLTVAAPPASVDLAELTAVDSDCSVEDVQLNGARQENSLTCRAGESEFAEAVYLLNRRTARLEAVLGQPDTGQPGRRVRLEVVGDGRVLAAEVLGYGEARQIGVDTVGVLRLQLRVRVEGEGTETVYGAFGTARVIGGPADVAALKAPTR